TTSANQWKLIGTVPTLTSSVNPFFDGSQLRLAGLAVDRDGNAYGSTNVTYDNGGFFVWNRRTKTFTVTNLANGAPIASGGTNNYAGITKMVTGSDGNVYACANAIFSYVNDATRIHAILKLNS